MTSSRTIAIVGVAVLAYLLAANPSAVMPTIAQLHAWAYPNKTPPAPTPEPPKVEPPAPPPKPPPPVVVEPPKPEPPPEPPVVVKPEPKPQPKPATRKPAPPARKTPDDVCAKVRMGVAWYGEAYVRAEAKRRGYSNAQINQAIRDCT